MPKDNIRSQAVTHGIERAPNRAMLRAVGFSDADFDKPIVAVANGYSTITPCNMGLNLLTDRAVASLKQAGTMPQVFGTITVSDGISMGTDGMKYSLISREVIADSIETVCQGQQMDGLVAIGGCDKNMPGAMMAIGRLNIPSIFVYGGTIKAGRYDGRDLTVVSAFEAVGEFAAGKIDEKELTEIEGRACPGAGSCGGMYTANTMSSAIEALGLSLPYGASNPAVSAAKEREAFLAGKALMGCVERNLRPRDLITRKSLENAYTLVLALGGSTNAVLHLMAIAREAGVGWTLDDFDRLGAKVPHLADLKPGGRYVMFDLYKVGGTPAVLRALLDAKLLHGDCVTVTGKTLVENLKDTVSVYAKPQDVVKPFDHPM